MAMGGCLSTTTGAAGLIQGNGGGPTRKRRAKAGGGNYTSPGRDIYIRHRIGSFKLKGN